MSKKNGAAVSVRVIDHPRARRQLHTARGWGGLGGLLLAGLAAHGAGLPAFDVGVRALAGGVAGLLIGWALALTVWRQLVVAELRAAARRLEAEAGEG